MGKANFPGMPGNMGELMKQAQRMQEDLMKKQEEMTKMEVTASAGGGAVTAIITGNKELKSLEISKDIVDANDMDMLQDLIIAAVNEGIRKVKAQEENMMGDITGGMKLPF